MPLAHWTWRRGSGVAPTKIIVIHIGTNISPEQPMRGRIPGGSCRGIQAVNLRPKRNAPCLQRCPHGGLCVVKSRRIPDRGTNRTPSTCFCPPSAKTCGGDNQSIEGQVSERTRTIRKNDVDSCIRWKEGIRNLGRKSSRRICLKNGNTAREYGPRRRRKKEKRPVASRRRGARSRGVPVKGHSVEGFQRFRSLLASRVRPSPRAVGVP